MKHLKILFLFLLVAGPVCRAERPAKTERKAVRKARPIFLTMSTGSGFMKLRDQATSPLFYQGAPMHAGFSWIRYDRVRETEIGVDYFFGGLQSDYNNENATSVTNMVDLYYGRLYRVNAFNTDNWNLKVGGRYSFLSDFRINESLQNNALGMEFLSTLFASAKLSLDVSRRSDRDRKLWFIHCHFKERQRALSFQLNLAVVNSAFRNGYTYTGQAGVVNDLGNLFDGYQFTFFSGYRMSSMTSYTLWLRPGNRLRFSYVWDAFRTAGPYEPYEVARHILRVTFMFKTKN